MSSENNPDWLVKVSKSVIKHMNDDHSNSIVSTLHAQHGLLLVIKTHGLLVVAVIRLICQTLNIKNI